MTLATDLYLRLSSEESLALGMPSLLGNLVETLGTVVAGLVEESPSLAKFFPAVDDIVKWDLIEGPIVASIGGYELGLDVVGLLNKPIIVEGEDENKLYLIVDLSLVRPGSDAPFVATIGISQVGGVWEEFVPSLETLYEYEAIENLNLWFEGFLRGGLLEHSFAPGAFEMDSDVLVDDFVDDIIVEAIKD
jgi:hypothetical protein